MPARDRSCRPDLHPHRQLRADYNSATATAAINVKKATPALTWANPADITYGTALGAAQLDASASVPGSFVYTPGRGAPSFARRPRSRSSRRPSPRPTRPITTTRHHDDGIDQRPAGDADDHLVQPGRHHLRHAAGRGAAQRHGFGSVSAGVVGTFATYTPGPGHRAERRPKRAKVLSATFTPTNTARLQLRPRRP